MPKHNKIEKDFENSNAAIETIVKEEMRKIEKKTAEIKKEAEEIGKALELDLEENKAETTKKKT
jgi:hypothetical protein